MNNKKPMNLLSKMELRGELDATKEDESGTRERWV